MTTDPKSGLSSFLEHCVAEIRDEGLVFAVDGASQEPGVVFQQILLQMQTHYREIWRDFLAYASEDSGDGTTSRVIKAAIACVPYVGPGLDKLSGGPSNVLPVTHFPSYGSEMLGRYFLRIATTQSILLLIDNVQDLDQVSLAFLRVLCSPAYTHVRFLACFVRRSNSEHSTPNEFIQTLRLIRSDCELIEFESPGPNLVRDMAAVYGVRLPQNVDRAIALAADGDVYRVLASLRELSGTASTVPLDADAVSPISRYILRLLLTARQPLRGSDLLAITMQDRTLFIRSVTDVEASFGQLSDNGITTSTALPDGDRLVALRQQSAVIRSGMLHDGHMIQTASTLYEYFLRVATGSSRHAETECPPLLYRLAKVVAPNDVSRHLRAILRLSIRMGSLDAGDRFVEPAFGQLGDGDASDYIGRLAYLAARKEYGVVVDATEEERFSRWNDSRPARILRAIALNRERRHSESEALLEKLAREPKSLDELATIVSYWIVGRLHANDTAGARELYDRYRIQLKGCARFGYFCRNAAAAFEFDEAIIMQREAIVSLTKFKDEFGIATTECNLAGDLATIGRSDEALELIEHASGVLSIYGMQHLNIVEGNRCHCLLYARRYASAEEAGVHSLRFMGTDLPRIFTLTNIAAARALAGDHASAAQALVDGERAVVQVEVDRAKQKFYVNAALIALMAGLPLEQARMYLDASYEHPDTRQVEQGERTRQALEELIKGAQAIGEDEFWPLYSPCILLYWYENPLEAITLQSLPCETVT